MLRRICNPPEMNIRIYNPIIASINPCKPRFYRIENPYVLCCRIANPAEHSCRRMFRRNCRSTCEGQPTPTPRMFRRIYNPPEMNIRIYNPIMASINHCKPRFYLISNPNIQCRWITNPPERRRYFIRDLLYLGLMFNEPRRGGQITGRRWSAKHGTPAKSMV